MFWKKLFYKIVNKFWQFFAKKTQNKSFDSVSFIGNYLLQNLHNQQKIKIKINGVEISKNSSLGLKPSFVSSYQKNKKLLSTK